jgi:hypothetical protein
MQIKLIDLLNESFVSPAAALKSVGHDIKDVVAREGGKVGTITYHFKGGKTVILKRKSATSPYEVVSSKK